MRRPRLDATSARTARKTASRTSRKGSESIDSSSRGREQRDVDDRTTIRAGRCDSTTTRSARRTASSTSCVTSSAAPRALLERSLEPGLRVETGLRVERGERLVECEHRALGDQRAHERHALAHAA